MLRCLFVLAGWVGRVWPNLSFTSSSYASYMSQHPIQVSLSSQSSASLPHQVAWLPMPPPVHVEHSHILHRATCCGQDAVVGADCALLIVRLKQCHTKHQADGQPRVRIQCQPPVGCCIQAKRLLCRGVATLSPTLMLHLVGVRFGSGSLLLHPVAFHIEGFCVCVAAASLTSPCFIDFTHPGYLQLAGYTRVAGGPAASLLRLQLITPCVTGWVCVCAVVAFMPRVESTVAANSSRQK